MLRLLLALTLLTLTTGMVRAGGEPKKKPDAEQIPAPKMIGPMPKQLEPAPQILVAPRPQRTDTMEVWQHYGVNRFGRIVPRVIAGPYDAYYSRNLEPFPWVQNRAAAVMPYVVD